MALNLSPFWLGPFQTNVKAQFRISGTTFPLQENIAATLAYIRKAIMMPGWSQWDVMTERLHFRYCRRTEREEMADSWAQLSNLGTTKAVDNDVDSKGFPAIEDGLVPPLALPAGLAGSPAITAGSSAATAGEAAGPAAGDGAGLGAPDGGPAPGSKPGTDPGEEAGTPGAGPAPPKAGRKGAPKAKGEPKAKAAAKGAAKAAAARTPDLTKDAITSTLRLKRKWGEVMSRATSLARMMPGRPEWAFALPEPAGTLNAAIANCEAFLTEHSFAAELITLSEKGAASYLAGLQQLGDGTAEGGMAAFLNAGLRVETVERAMSLLVYLKKGHDEFAAGPSASGTPLS